VVAQVRLKGGRAGGREKKVEVHRVGRGSDAPQ
jgi:hypothetical protein